MKPLTNRLIDLIAALVVAGAGLAGATDYTWTGAGDGKWWTNASNWGGSGYPNGAGDTALIASGSPAITNSGDLTLGALTLGTGFTGTNTLGGNLTVTGNLTLAAGTLQTARNKASGIAVGDTFLIGAGSTGIVRRASTNNYGTGQTISAGTLIVSGLLQADEQGFDAAKGPGVGISADGGSHGGRGGDYQYNFSTGPTYGSFINPTSLGSGSDQMPGGGAIVIAVSGAVTVNGTISAKGGGNATSRGGAGGSINITAASLAGAGTIRASGGEGPSNVGSGGGGRLAFAISGTDTFAGLLEVKGGGFGGSYPGSAGTIYLSQQKRTSLTLGGAGNMRTLRLGTDDTMGPAGSTNYGFGSVTIETNGTLEVDGNMARNVVNGKTNGTAAVLRLATLEVKTNGLISANGLGWAVAMGPGVPTNGNIGAAYGGNGGKGYYSILMKSGATYGSVTNPIALGSGINVGSGGGAILIAATGAVTNDGTISANGLANGGSGGSVNLSAASLAGKGKLQAKGGSSNNDQIGCGGGGRIAVALSSGTDFGSVTCEAFGGFFTGPFTFGGAGTVSLKRPGYAELIVDNNGKAAFYSTELDSAGGTLADYTQVTLRKSGNLGIRDSDRLDFSQVALGGDRTGSLTLYATNGVTFPGDFTLPTNCTLCFDAPVAMAGNWTIPAWGGLSHNYNYAGEDRKLTLTLNGSLTIQANGFIMADAKGYYIGKGPGQGVSADGPSHGGQGGDYAANNTLRPTYGSALNPTNFGTGSTFARGGGAINLTVSGALTNNGIISANGESNAGGGAGGSVKITADTLSGAGAIQARGGEASTLDWGSGGGGRVAVVLNSGSSAGGVAIDAAGGTNYYKGAAGTVYLQGAGQAPGRGQVRVDNPFAVARTNTATEIPSLMTATNAPQFLNELAWAPLLVTNKGVLALTTHVTVGDLFLKGTSVTSLYLRGWTLSVNASYHPDWGSTGAVNYAGGQIVWKPKQGAVIVVR